MRKRTVFYGAGKLPGFPILLVLLLLLGLAEQAGATDISGLKIDNDTADDANDVFNGGSPADPIGGANNGIIVKGGNSPTSGHTVEVTGNVGDYSVVGGGSSSGNVQGNTLIIKDGGNVGSSDKGSAVGGITMNGDATGNQVIMESGSNVERDVTGGASASGNAEGNTVRITDGTVGRHVLGGAAGRTESTGVGDAVGNTVYIEGDSTVIGEDVYGGAAGTNGGNAVRNTVNITGGTVIRAVFGGQTSKGNAIDNTVNITGGTVKGYVVGGDTGNGSTDAGDAVGNTVNIAGGTVDGVYTIGDPGTSNTKAGVIGGLSTKGNAENNVVINRGTINNGGDVYGGVVLGGSGNAAHNTVTNTGTLNSISGGAKADVIGGYVGNSGTGNADYNTVNFLDGQAWDIKGGRASGSNAGSADYNKVIISGGTITGNVFGGHTDGTSQSASNNTVEILGGVFETTNSTGQSIYGGRTSADGSAKNNTVILSGSPSFNSLHIHIYGGYGGDSGTGDYVTGNTLKVHNYSGTNAFESIRNFQNFDFLLPSSVKAGDIILSAEYLHLGATAAGNSSRVTGLAIAGGGQALKDGDAITLIYSNHTYGDFEGSTFQAAQGAMLNYTLLASRDGNNIVATVQGDASVSPQAKSLSEGYLSGVALINQGADLAVDKGIAVAVRSALAPGLQAFGTFGGGHSRYNTGSHVDVNGFSLLAGLSFGAGLTPGRLTLGAFFEYGQGDYDTRNSFSNAAAVKGGGDTEYVGGGVLGRFDFISTGPGHFYAEATGRMGQVTSDYSSSDLRDALGRTVNYDTSGLYYGLHFGAGYIWNITDKADLDLYGKYLWSHQDGDSVRLSTGDPVRFDDVESHRLRGGARFAYAVNDYVSPYIGAAYEHEFDGKAKASTYGHAIDAPDLTGGTGIGELGLTVRTGEVVSFDIGVQGYTGTREGVTGSLQLKLEF
ncbi:MAG: autotransporter domain-containing protein [Desulfovibrio sp.]|nr:autotransporter domain-containing protein [Desulfovibrio sp.]